MAITKYVGEVALVTYVRYQYEGPARTIYFCWGLKARGPDYNNGANLDPSYHFGYAPVQAPRCDVPTWKEAYISAELEILANMLMAVHDTYTWWASKASCKEADIITAGGHIDTDADIYDIRPAKGVVHHWETPIYE